MVVGDSHRCVLRNRVVELITLDPYGDSYVMAFPKGCYRKNYFLSFLDCSVMREGFLASKLYTESTFSAVLSQECVGDATCPRIRFQYRCTNNALGIEREHPYRLASTCW